MFIFTALVLLPIIVAVMLWRLPFERLQPLMFLFSGILSVLAVLLFLNPVTFAFSLGSFFHALLIVVDLGLILFFLKEGLSFKNSKVWMLALSQLILFVIAETVISGGGNKDFIIDELSIFMFTVINIVGSLIVAFAVWYIEKEPISEDRRRCFLFYLTLFLTVMNLIVVANSLMIFFLLFEMTTLASYLLIGFRKDELSQNNALRALWMNQIGGIFILGAMIFAAKLGVAPYFDAFLGNTTALIGLALLSMAALIKGAQTPFDSWLLGAMVAPTPVSAILHSATMVKIAPFVVLKLAPGYEGTLLGQVIIAFGAFVFIVAGIYGLSKDNFKEVLGYSTISLLGLMVSMAVAGGEEGRNIVYILIFFHAISKALLFLLAGVLEKNHHLKYISQMDGLLHKAPLTASMIMLGFATITLPPFGLFFGKLFSIEIVAHKMAGNFAFLILAVSLAIGSAILTLLYFKVASLLFSKHSDDEAYEYEPFFSMEMVAPFAYTAILLAAAAFMVVGSMKLPATYVFGSLAMIFIVPLWLKLDPFRGVDRCKEYFCGEQENFSIAQWTYSFTKQTETKMALIGAGAFVAMAVIGGLI